MNYYEHHLGDYLRDTAHLSMLEDGAYRRLIDAYYIREAPLPAELRDVFRLVRAQSKQDREAAETVLREFFIESPDGWRHSRCDREVAAYAETIPDRESRRENDRERQRRARERRKDLFERLRTLDIVPAYDTNTSDLESMLSRAQSRDASRDVTPPVTRDNTATQTPDTKHQKKDKSPPAARVPPCPDGVDPGVWGDWLQLRKAKRAPVTDTVLDGARAEAGKAGLTLDAFLRVWCSRGSQGLLAEWLKPNERAPQRRNGHEAEPEWRREQRERNEAALGPYATKRRAPNTVDMEPSDVPPILVD